VKLLLDENLSRRIVPFLQADFPGTSQVAQSLWIVAMVHERNMLQRHLNDCSRSM
jgi:hypothetical protein